MKLYSSIVLAATLVLNSATAQTNVPTHIKGTLDIRYNTRTQKDGDKPKAGVTDKYNLTLNVCDTAIFVGTVDARPTIPGRVYGINQVGLLTYNIDLNVCNPKNVAQCKLIGKLFGTVPVSEKNVYDFEHGTVKAAINGLGQAQPFDSKFSGVALGKPPVVKEGVFSQMKKQAMNIGKSVNGKTVTIVVNNYDIMQFNNLVMAAGPAQSYPEVTANGLFVYDYARSVWYMKDLTCSYTIGNIRYQDRITGNVRWVEAPDRKTTGSGEYQFDVRVNEPLATEVAVFDNTQADESAFFAEDSNVTGLTGTMKYKDTILGGDTVTASQVGIDLKGNKLSKQQAMYLAKLFMLTAIVPLNAE